MTSTFPVSKNVAAMQTSSTLKAAQKAANLRAEGHNIVDLTVGEPDFDTPEFIKQFACEGLEKGFTKYTPSSGLRSFTEGVAEFYAAEFGAGLSPSEVVASCGGKQALFNAACTILDPGDEVLVPRPYWVTFPEIVTFCGAKTIFVGTEETGFVLTADQVRAAITDKTKLLILNSPSNPSGRVIPSAEMRRIIETCAERRVYVLTDECYLFFAYPPGEVFTSAVLPPELREFVCVAGSFSKTFAMTGWRIGFTIANESWTREMIKLQSHSATHPTSFVQYACARAMQERETTMAAIHTMLAEYQRRRDWLIPQLNSIEGFECLMPEGAFYAFVDVRKLIGGELKTSSAVGEKMLEKAHAAVTDGAAFGDEGYLRLSYATSMENLKTAVKNFAEVFGRSNASVA